MKVINIFWLRILWCDKKTYRTAFGKIRVPTQAPKNMQSMDNNIINATFSVQIRENFKNI